MLVRRLMPHLKRQDWLAVGIDFLIVVFGIFFGFQVTDWNQARQDRVLEREYLARIAGDVTRSRQQMVISNNDMRTQVNGATLVLRALDACRVPVAERNDFATALYRIGKYDSVTLDNTALDELTSTGRSAVLRSVALKEALSRLDQAAEFQHRIEPQFLARTSPFVNYIQFRVQFDPPEPLNPGRMTWDRMRIDLPAACRDEQFRASVSAVRDLTMQIIYLNDSILDRMDAVLVRLKG